MSKQDIFKTLNKYKKYLEDNGYNVLYIGLYGSQNYNCDDELSDIDAKAIILPSLHDIIFRNTTSKVIECENGAIDVKDLITFYNVIKKGNFSYIESIDTEYFIGDKSLKKMLSIYRPNLKSIYGAMLEKRKALTHEYPSKAKEFERFKCDPKQYHHIIRLRDLLINNVRNNDTKSYLRYGDGLAKDFMIRVKRNGDSMGKEQLEDKADFFINDAKLFIPENYEYTAVNIDNDINNYIENCLKLELTNNSQILSAREYRTFDNGIPKKDLEKFPILKKYEKDDISYIVYESLEIL